MMSTKHELWRGEVIPMGDASFVHVQIVSNLIGALGNARGDGPCVVLPSSMMVYVPVRDSYVCLDVAVACGQPEFVGGGTDVIALRRNRALRSPREVQVLPRR